MSEPHEVNKSDSEDEGEFRPLRLVIVPVW